MNTSDDQNVLTHTKKLGNSEFQVFCKSYPQTAHLIYSIEQYLRNYPSFYYNSILMINKGRPLQTIQKRLKTQYENLLGQKSFYHMMRKALTSRQKCIDKIKRGLSKAQRILTIFKKEYINPDNENHAAYLQYVEQQGYTNVQVDETVEDSIKLISSIFIDMCRLRDMTLYIVQSIHQWKFSIEEWLDKCNQYQPVFFMYDQINVYDKISQDTNFIWQSSLSEYIFLNIKTDPFIVRNVLQIQQRAQKTVLQKYFIEILYPKNEEIVSKSIKCYEMLTFKYQPQINNLYYEEELLIQNYLSLQKKQQDQKGNQQLTQDQFEWEDKMKKQKKQKQKQKLHSKGWVFGNKLKKPHSDRIKQIIQRHKHKITFIKPFAITNFQQKNSLALAYLAQAKQKKQEISNIGQNGKETKSFVKIYRSRSMNKVDILKIDKKKLSKDLENNGYRSESQQKKLKKKNLLLYQSLSRLSPVIFEDPQQDHQTPKNQQKQKNNIFQNNYFSHSQSQTIINKQMRSFKKQDNRKQQKLNIHENKNQQQRKQVNKQDENQKLIELVTLKTKFNTFNKNFDLNNQFKQNSTNNDKKEIQQVQDKLKKKILQQIFDQKQQNQFDQILVDQQQKKLNFGDFLTNFRSITTQKIKTQKSNELKSSRQIKIKDYQQKLLNIKELIQYNKLKGIKSSRSRSILNQKHTNNIFSLKKPLHIGPKQTKQIEVTKKLDRSQQKNNSFVEYQKQVSRHQPKVPFKFDEDFIMLNSKSIPYDIVPDYLRHIFNQIHSTSKKFTLYSYDEILKKLQDPYTHCFIFDVSTQKKGHIGQVILTQSIGINNQKLKFTIEFINIHIFELIVATILRITEQILTTTTCEQVIVPLIQDKLDSVSVHFIDLIQSAFKIKVDHIGKLTILEKKKLYYKDSDLYQRLYVFSKKNKNQYHINISKHIRGNYRSLRFQTKSLLLASNFRMRSKTVSKNVISTYDSISIGYMYIKILDKILTKFHLTQMKKASLKNSNESDESVNLIKQNSFLKTLIASLTQYLKQQGINYLDYVDLTRFQNMSQVLTYLDYKQYSQYFHFNFLQQSRFILNHELYISQIDIDFSLQFMVRSSVDFLLLYNYHNLTLKFIQPSLNSKAKSVILPTTHDQIDLIIIDGRQYDLQITDKLDLFSYLYIYQQEIKKYKQIHGIKEIVIPTIHKNVKNMNSIKLFDGLFRLFPEREFYSGSYFKCTNLWESYFPSAVIYKPSTDSLVFQYPLIVGFLNKQRNQIISAFILRQNMAS